MLGRRKTVNKTTKVMDLIQILIRQNGYLTANELAKELIVSPRTIHNYLKSTEFTSLIYSNELEKTPNAGIKLNLTSQRKIQLLAKIKKTTLIPINEHNFNDFTSILIQLVTEKNYLSYKTLEKKLYKSSSSIQALLQEVTSFISKFSCEIVYLKNNGVKLVGSENDIRSLFLFVLTNYLSFHDEDNQFDRISKRTEAILHTFFTHKEKDELVHLADVCETAMKVNICENDYNLLLLYLMIIIIRLKNNFYSNEIYNTSIEKSVEYQYAILLKFHIEQRFQLTFPDSELSYLSRILMSTRKQTNIMTESNESKVIDRFIELIGTRLNIDLRQDKELSRNLNTHLRPAINRMKQGIPFSNPLLDYIKNDYTEVYLSVLTTIDDLEKMENIYFDANEIGYICLHIIAAISRPENINTIHTALICNEGLSIEQFLINLISSYFKELNITEIYRSNTIDELDATEFDLIINSTGAIIKSPNVVEISPSFTQKDFSIVKHFINFNALEKELKKSYLQDHLLYFKMSFTNQEEFIDRCCHYLLENHYVTNRFSSTVFERQKKSSTYVARGIAVLHGSKEEVLRSSVLIINLGKEIEWEGYRVKTIIFIVSNDENPTVFSQLLRQVMRIASSDFLTTKLHACEDLGDVFSLLENMEKKMR